MDVEIYPNPNGGVFTIHTKGIEAGVTEVAMHMVLSGNDHFKRT
jgi:hypothetical protein